MTVYPHDHLWREYIIWECIIISLNSIYCTHTIYIYCRIMQQLGITAYNIGVQIDGLVFSPYIVGWAGLGGLGNHNCRVKKSYWESCSCMWGTS